MSTKKNWCGFCFALWQSSCILWKTIYDYDDDDDDHHHRDDDEDADHHHHHHHLN